MCRALGLFRTHKQCVVETELRSYVEPEQMLLVSTAANIDPWGRFERFSTTIFNGIQWRLLVSRITGIIHLLVAISLY